MKLYYEIYTKEYGKLTIALDEMYNNESNYIKLTWHRENGPAKIRYEAGRIVSEEYFVNDVRHNLGGPACINYDKSGKIINEKYYVDGVLYFTLKSFEQASFKYKLKFL